MIYETKDIIRLIKEHKVDHQFLRASEIEMDITDEVRRQTGIVFPAEKIREQRSQVNNFLKQKGKQT